MSLQDLYERTATEIRSKVKVSMLKLVFGLLAGFATALTSLLVMQPYNYAVSAVVLGALYILCCELVRRRYGFGVKEAYVTGAVCYLPAWVAGAAILYPLVAG